MPTNEQPDAQSNLSETGDISTVLKCDWTLMDIVRWAAIQNANAFCPKCGRVPADHEDDRERP